MQIEHRIVVSTCYCYVSAADLCRESKAYLVKEKTKAKNNKKALFLFHCTLSLDSYVHRTAVAAPRRN